MSTTIPRQHSKKEKIESFLQCFITIIILKVVGLKGSSIDSVRDNDLMTTEGIRVTQSYNKMALNNGDKILAAL